MKTIKRTLVTLALGLIATGGAYANEGGGCHFHGKTPAQEKTVLDCADQFKGDFIGRGRLDASWKSVKPSKVEQIENKRGKEWKLTYVNAAAAEKSKQTLFMFFTLPGNFIAANYDDK
jgi:hypothetical protein